MTPRGEPGGPGGGAARVRWWGELAAIAVATSATFWLTYLAWDCSPERLVRVTMTTSTSLGVQVLSTSNVVAADRHGTVNAVIAGAVSDSTMQTASFFVWDLGRGPRDERDPDVRTSPTVAAGAVYGSYTLGATGSVLAGPREYDYELWDDRDVLIARGRIETAPLADPGRSRTARFVVTALGLFAAMLEVAQLAGRVRARRPRRSGPPLGVPPPETPRPGGTP